MKISILSICYFIQFCLIGQTTNIQIADSSKIKKSFFSIEINPFFTSKVKYDNQGANLARSKHLFCGEVGIGFTREINDNWYWQSSLNIGLMPFNFNFEFDAPENSIFQTGPYKDDYKTLEFNWSEYYYIQVYSSLDAVFSRKIHTFKNNAEFLLGAGIRIFAFFVDDYEYEYTSTWEIDENNSDVRLFYAHINDTISNRLKVSLLLEATYLKTLKNKHKFKTSIFFNYSPFKNVEGYYRFSNLGFQSYGTFRQNLTYLGLRLNYFIPMRPAKKKLNLMDFNPLCI